VKSAKIKKLAHAKLSHSARNSILTTKVHRLPNASSRNVSEQLATPIEDQVQASFKSIVFTPT